MSVHVLLIGKKRSNARLVEHSLAISQRVLYIKKINNTGARMLDSVYHITLKLLLNSV